MKANIEILAKANMLRNGKSFMVVQTPDWNGGHFFKIREYEYELGDFEYIAWLGTPLAFATEQPVFVGHREPQYEEPYDYEVTAIELISAAVKRWN